MKKNWSRRIPIIGEHDAEVEAAMARGNAHAQMQAFIDKVAAYTHQQRTEIVETFAAKHGFDVDTAIQEFGRTADGKMTWRVREMTEAEQKASRVARAQRQLEAEKITGEPVKVYGVAHATVLGNEVMYPSVFLTEKAAQAVCGKRDSVRELVVVP